MSDFKLNNNNSTKLIVAFAGNALKLDRLPMFNFTRSLTVMGIDSDILLMKDTSHSWYLETLKGIGSCVEDTVTFLSEVIHKYDKVVFLGASSGGFASVLYGSILKIPTVIAFIPQTDLPYILNNRKSERQYTLLNDFRERNSESFFKYGNLKDYINDNTVYHIHYSEKSCDLQHNKHHYVNVYRPGNVYKMPCSVKESISNGDLEKLLISALF